MAKQLSWYAHTTDTMSNRIISTYIGGGADREVRITCEDGTTLSAWHLNEYADYRALSKNDSVKAKFFVAEGNDVARPYPLPKREGNPERSGREIGRDLLAKARRAKSSSCS